MRTIARGALAQALVSLGLLGLTLDARSDETEVSLKDVPRAVLDAVKARFPGAEMKKAARETEDDKTFYEVSLQDRGKNMDVLLTPEGKFTEIETELAAADLPRAVSTAVEARYPRTKIKKAEEIVAIEDGKETKSYEVLLTREGKESVEVKLSPEGKVLKEEAGDEDDDEK